MKLKKGDNVIITAGKDKGKKGKIIKVFPAKNRVIVEGANLLKKHQKPRKSGEKGQTITIPSPLNSSNVMILDPKTGKGSRMGKKQVGGKMIRISKKSGQEI